MTNDPTGEPRIPLLLEALLQKTEEGKLKWQQTVDEHTFIAAQANERILEVSAAFGGVREWGDRLAREVAITFVVRDGQGNPIVEHTAIGEKTLEFQLYRSAERVARRVVEEVDKLIEWANSV